MSFAEAMIVFADPLVLLLPDPRHSIGEERFAILGLYECGRLLQLCSLNEASVSDYLVLAGPPPLSGTTMKKPRAKKVAIDPDELLPEYDFSKGERNRYADRFQAGTVAVVLDPDVAELFPSAAKVNAALRSLKKSPRNSSSKRSTRRRTA